MKPILVLLTGLLLCPLFADHPLRTWRSGPHELEAAFVDFIDRSARLRKADGTTLDVPVQRFHEDDQAHLKQIVAVRRQARPLRYGNDEAAALAEEQLNEAPELGPLERRHLFESWLHELSTIATNPPPFPKRAAKYDLVLAHSALQTSAQPFLTGIDAAKVAQLRSLQNELRASYQTTLQSMIDLAPITKARADHETLTARWSRFDPATLATQRDELNAIGELLAALELSARPAPDKRLASKEPTTKVAQLAWRYTRARQIEEANKAVPDISPEERINIQQVNAYRELLGLAPLSISPELVLAARSHSLEMQNLKYFSHTSPTPGSGSFTQRAKLAGFTGFASGENIFFGLPGGQAAFNAWFNSPGHHQNMVNPGHRLIGVGRSNTHWTQVFGKE